MTKSTNPLDFVADLLDSVADRLEESIKNADPKPEANHTPQRPEEVPVETVVSSDIQVNGGIIDNPFISATQVLEKVEAIADDLDDLDKASLLLEVAKGHTEIGKQLLDSFDF